MSSSSAAAANPFGEAIAALRRHVAAPFFLQIGGFDGQSFDPLRTSIVAHNLAGLIVEPIPQYFQKLQELYAGSETVMTANYAVAEENGTRTLWRFDPEAIAQGRLEPHFAGISSFVMDDLLSAQGVLGRSSPNAETTEKARALVQPVDVVCRTIDALLREFGISRVDILQIDTEGYDLVILNMFDFARYRPAVVQYEHQHLNPSDAASAMNLLQQHGYRLVVQQYDTLALLDPPVSQVNIPALRRLAESLVKSGQSNQALTLLEHLRDLVPEDVSVLVLLAQTQEADGKLLDAMATVVALQKHVSDDLLGGLIQSVKLCGFEAFNAHVAAGRLQQAALYIAQLAAILPRHAQIQDSAFRVNRALGRTRLATHYAISALALDPGNHKAGNFLKDTRGDPATAGLEADLRIARALSPPARHPPVYVLRDLHFAASAILCAPLTPQRVAQLEHIVATAAVLEIPPATGNEATDDAWPAWERVYRLIFKTIDLAPTNAPTPSHVEQSLSLVAADGMPLDWTGISELARRRRARLVFFAAGDESYVLKYAPWYARSILKHADISCLVLVHVIGAGERLPEMLRALNIKDERLIFAGDGFDAAAISTICYDAPDYGTHTKPVAHFQSARFQRLPELLTRLELPVCVSDIDLVLQRGVADMLEMHAAADVVLNENLYGLSVADRVTANLLLVRPTAAGLRFARFVAGYLDRALAEPAVIRWVDQIALLMGRHHLARAGEACIGVFDADTDINNTIYKAYQPNPYRFLSLYQWFDMASLDVLGLDALSLEATDLEDTGLEKSHAGE